MSKSRVLYSINYFFCITLCNGWIWNISWKCLLNLKSWFILSFLPSHSGLYINVWNIYIYRTGNVINRNFYVSDAIADWITKGFAFGPVDEKDVPIDAKVNGIMCKQKPKDSVRIILNLSSPLGNSWEGISCINQ